MQVRLETLRKDADEDAVRECTFHPVINTRSDRMMSQRSEVLKVTCAAIAGREWDRREGRAEREGGGQERYRGGRAAERDRRRGGKGQRERERERGRER